MNHKPYPNYKDTGIQWIGEIPADWEIERFKIRYKRKKGKIPNNLDEINGKDYLPYLSMEYLRGKEENPRFSNDSKALKVDKGDLLLLWDGSNAGEFITAKKGYLSSTMVKLSTENMDDKYSWFLCSAFEPMLRDLTIGMGIPHVNGDVLGNIRIPIVEIIEQQKIVSFLDAKTSEINQTIEKDKQLINLLKEKRTALINYLVTKGLDPNAKMKDSGIDWIGQIPERWNVKKIKHELAFFDSQRIPLSAEVRGLMIERTYDYYGASGVIDKVEDYLFDGTYILLGEDGANLQTRSTPLAFLASGKFWVNNHAHILKPINGNIYYFVDLLDVIDYSVFISGSAQPKLTADNLKGVIIPVPPIEEQNEIAKHILNFSTKMDKTIRLIQNKINLFEEYKKSLIHHVITGKVDVREVAI